MFEIRATEWVDYFIKAVCNVRGTLLEIRGIRNFLYAFLEGVWRSFAAGLMQMPKKTHNNHETIVDHYCEPRSLRD